MDVKENLVKIINESSKKAKEYATRTNDADQVAGWLSVLSGALDILSEINCSDFWKQKN